jgi:glucokinase
VPRLGAHFDALPFRSRFEDKGRFSGYLAQIPTWVITAEAPALLGAARALDRLA